MLFGVLGGGISWRHTFIFIIAGQGLVQFMLDSLQGVPDLQMDILMIL